MTDHPVIRTERLAKSYGRRRGLDGLDLEVRPGEVFGYLGPNGAGKTTTIRLLLDLIRPSGGDAWVLGSRPRAGGPALRRRIGYLPGDFAIDGRQSVREALTYLGNLRGGVPAARIRELAERLDLELGARVASLSKGNRQKIALVQAFMHGPELLILDEPTSGLDPLVQQQFLAMVRQARQAGQTVFMSSHVLSEVQHVADRVGIIRAGRLAAVEDVQTLRDRAQRRIEIRFALLQRFAALAAAMVAVGAIVLVVLLGVSGPTGLDLAADKLAAMCLHLTLLGLCFGTLALAVGAFTGRRSLVLAVTASVGAATYIANSFLGQIDALAWTPKLSPFYYYDAGQPLRNGVQLAHAGVLLGVCAVLLAAGAVAFNRRDIAV